MSRRPSPAPDLTAAEVAKALGWDVAEFLARRAAYESSGLRADPISGRYDPEGFERWRRLRSPHLFPELAAPLTGGAGAIHAAAVVKQRLASFGG